MILPDGTVLVDPSDAQVGSAGGAAVDPAQSEFDVVIVGPGRRASRPRYTAPPRASPRWSWTRASRRPGRLELADPQLPRVPARHQRRPARRAGYEQAWVFGANFAFMQCAVGIQRDADRIRVMLAQHGAGERRAVILATGVTYRRLGIPELEELNGAGVFYGGPASEAQGLQGPRGVRVGGANSAGQAALHLARYVPRDARRPREVARGRDVALPRASGRGRGECRCALDSEVVGGGADGTWLDHLVLRSADGEEERCRPRASS